MYQASLFKNTPQQSGGGIKIPVGIHSGGVNFTGLIIEDGWADICFSSKDGRSIYKRMFTPNGSLTRDGESVADAEKRETDRNLRLLVYVMQQLLGEDVVSTFAAPTYQAFLKGAKTLLDSKKGVEVNLKVVPDYREKKYPDLPLRDFVELHDPSTPTKLFYTKAQAEDVEKMLDARTEKAEEEIVF